MKTLSFCFSVFAVTAFIASGSAYAKPPGTISDDRCVVSAQLRSAPFTNKPLNDYAQETWKLNGKVVGGGPLYLINPSVRDTGSALASCKLVLKKQVQDMIKNIHKGLYQITSLSIVQPIV